MAGGCVDGQGGHRGVLSARVLFWDARGLAVALVGGAVGALLGATTLYSQNQTDAIFQGYYWNTFPGDLTDINKIHAFCDGLRDETQASPGTNPSYVVEPMIEVTQGGPDFWMYVYEASRPDA